MVIFFPGSLDRHNGHRGRLVLDDAGSTQGISQKFETRVQQDDPFRASLLSHRNQRAVIFFFQLRAICSFPALIQ